jgi:hypothetical protein
MRNLFPTICFYSTIMYSCHFSDLKGCANLRWMFCTVTDFHLHTAELCHSVLLLSPPRNMPSRHSLARWLPAGSPTLRLSSHPSHKSVPCHCLFVAVAAALAPRPRRRDPRAARPSPVSEWGTRQSTDWMQGLDERRR